MSIAKRSSLPSAFVIGLDCVTGLQTARILARHNIPVVGIASNPQHFSCRSRACRTVMPANTSTEAFIDVLIALGPSLDQKAVLFPCTDPSVLLISRNRSRLKPWYHVVLPDPEVVELLVDKASFYKYAVEHELPVPATRLLYQRADAEEASETFAFPVILKPPVRTDIWEGEGLAKVYRASSPSELLELYDRLAPWAKTLLVQEWVEGSDRDLYSCNCYYDEGSKPLVTFVARKVRQWRPEAGTSSLGEECRNEIVLETTLRLFGDARFRGLGYLEMKQDRRTGRHVIIEPNIGRPTGRSAIAEIGGVELLFTKYCDSVGLPLPENREQKYRGAKWIYLRHDFQSALYYWRRKELTLREWRRSWRGCRRDAVFEWRDPAPFFLDLWSTARRLATSRKPLS
ncbi:MAG: carboxylate--amine ligase [Actinomycetota bacterium]